jgi:hypothetical protein
MLAAATDCSARSSFQASRSSGWQPLPWPGLAPLAFLAGLLDARLAKGGVGELMVRLRADPTPDLGELLAQALRDPNLVLDLLAAPVRSWADQDGNPATLPEARTGGRRATIVKQNG